MFVTAIKLTEEDKIKASEKIAAVVSELGPRFAARATAADEQDRFVSENFAELKAHGLFAAGVPEELGGLGASHAELCEILRQIAYQCGSTGLAFPMHTDQVATNDPGLATTNRIMTGRTLVGRGVLKTVELAMEAAGGASFYRSLGLDRLLRGAQGARFHPLREGAQQQYAGRLALGLDVNQVC